MSQINNEFITSGRIVVSPCGCDAMPSINLLADCPQHVPTVAGWLYHQWLADMGWTENEATEAVRERLNRQVVPLAMVATSRGNAVGVASLVDELAPDGTEWTFFSGLYVPQEWRRQGIGTLLCRHLELRAAQLGLTQLGCYTDEAERFYTALGWQKDGLTQLDFGQTSRPASFMVRNLPI